MTTTLRFTLLFVMFGSVTAHAATPTLDEVWTVVQRQQQQIETLQAALRVQEQALAEAESELRDTRQALTRSEQEVAVQTERLEATAAMIDSSGTGAGPRDKVTIGGYGELHYNDLDNGEEIDFHRFVLYFGHQFTDNLSFYSEFELEHSLAGDGAPGEVELEQAFVQWDYAPGHRARAGLFLMPIGILNETHEPDTFYGVERNRVENQVIPTTWWEAGVGFDGEIAPGWGYDLAVHSGLNLKTSSGSPSSIRSGRQKVAEANGDSLAYTGRISFTGIPGLQWRTSLQYQADLTQSDDEGVGVGNIDASLLETNLTLERGIFGLRALYARWDLDDRIELLNPGASEQFGWYVEPSVRLSNNLGLFARYGRYDLTASSAAASDERGQFDVGVNYWVHDNVVIKLDFQRQDNDNGVDVDGFNLGVGYSF